MENSEKEYYHQQLSVEWLVEQLTAIGELKIPNGSNVVTMLISEAKEQEKYNIIEAYDNSRFDSYNNGTDYYNNTFNPEENDSN